MIMSKFPIEATDEITFVRGSASDSLTTKGSLYARVVVGSTKIHIFNTHLQASYGNEFDPNNYYAPIRKKQIAQLTEFVKRITAGDNYPIMLMGDFNVNAMRAVNDASDSEEYLHMISSLEGDLFDAADILKEHNGGMHPATHEGMGVFVSQDSKPLVGQQRLDFIFEMRRRDGKYGNTHKFTEAKVVPFHVKGRNDFTQLSDHLGSYTRMDLGPVSFERGSKLSEATISFYGE